MTHLDTIYQKSKTGIRNGTFSQLQSYALCIILEQKTIKCFVKKNYRERRLCFTCFSVSIPCWSLWLLSRCPPFLGALSLFWVLLYLSPTLLSSQLFLVPTLATTHLCSVPLSLLPIFGSRPPFCSTPLFVQCPPLFTAHISSFYFWSWI